MGTTKTSNGQCVLNIEELTGKHQGSMRDARRETPGLQRYGQRGGLERQYDGLQILADRHELHANSLAGLPHDLTGYLDRFIQFGG